MTALLPLASGPARLIALSDPDVSLTELQAVERVLRSPRLSSGEIVAAFEEAFAAYVGRRYAIAVPSATIGLLLILAAKGIGAGDEVIASPYGFRETAHAITLAGARPVFADIDYWSGTLVAGKAAAQVSDRTGAILAANNNGHPADWAALRDLADRLGVLLIEDSSEAIGSRYRGRLVGGFGDAALFDFSQPSPLNCGEGGMVVTDDSELAAALRQYRGRQPEDRLSVAAGARPAFQAGMGEMAAALGLAQLQRLDQILARRRGTEALYAGFISSFEGLKPPYCGPDADEVHWLLYLVHLGTRFSRSSRDAIIEDLRGADVEAAAYCSPLHTQRHYVDLGYRRGDFLVAEKLADRAIALPFHSHLDPDEIAFIVETMKESSINVGAGAAIYL